MPRARFMGNLSGRLKEDGAMLSLAAGRPLTYTDPDSGRQTGGPSHGIGRLARPDPTAAPRRIPIFRHRLSEPGY